VTNVMRYQEILDEVYTTLAPLVGSGRVVDYIPRLAAVDPRHFGLALATVDGDVCGVGDWRTTFSIQSVSKVFALALSMGDSGPGIWTRVGRVPSGGPFDGLQQLERERGVPLNPFVNAGALVVVDRLLSRTGDARQAVLNLLCSECGDEEIEVDAVVADSEAWHRHRHRNAALAHLLASYGNLIHPVEEVLDHYTAQCAIAMSCHDLALAGRFLARDGLRADGSRLLSRSDATLLIATMLTCGTGDGALQSGYRVALPAKSGVGGGILALVPDRYVLAVWAPGLDAGGNSRVGLAALDAFTALTRRAA